MCHGMPTSVQHMHQPKNMPLRTNQTCKYVLMWVIRTHRPITLADVSPPNVKAFEVATVSSWHVCTRFSVSPPHAPTFAFSIVSQPHVPIYATIFPQHAPTHEFDIAREVAVQICANVKDSHALAHYTCYYECTKCANMYGCHGHSTACLDIFKIFFDE